MQCYDLCDTTLVGYREQLLLENESQGFTLKQRQIHLADVGYRSSLPVGKGHQPGDYFLFSVLSKKGL